MVGCDDKVLSHADRRVVRPAVTLPFSLPSPQSHVAWDAVSAVWGVAFAVWVASHAARGAAFGAKRASHLPWGTASVARDASHAPETTSQTAKTTSHAPKAAPHGTRDAAKLSFSRGFRSFATVFPPRGAAFLPHGTVFHPFPGGLGREARWFAPRSGSYLPTTTATSKETIAPHEN